MDFIGHNPDINVPLAPLLDRNSVWHDKTILLHFISAGVVGVPTQYDSIRFVINEMLWCIITWIID